MNSEITICECTATEDDWLDISYSQRHYIREEDNALDLIREKNGRRKKAPKKWLIRGFALVLVLAALVAMRFVSEGFAGEVFAIAKATYTQSISEVVTAAKQKKNTIILPINVTIDNVDNGTVTITGGKVLLNFKAGKVTAKTDDTVTIGVDDKLQIVYGGLTKILVDVGDEVAIQSVLGKYSTAATVNLVYDGEVVKDVTTVDYTLVWKI